MTGGGPFGPRAAGTFNFTVDAPAHQLYLEPTPARHRVVVAGRVVADSTRASLLHETGLPPTVYLPREDVADGLLAPSGTRTHCPFKGDAAYHHLDAGDGLRQDAVWYYPDPIEGCPDLAALVAFDPAAVDAWFAETVEVIGHQRDPYHRVDAIPSDRRVTVRAAGELIATSDRPVLVFETGHPMRTYLPVGAVRAEVVRPSATATTCPYKGTTSRYLDVEVAGRRIRDALWVYDDPDPAVAAIAGLLGVDHERLAVDLEVVPFAPPISR